MEDNHFVNGGSLNMEQLADVFQYHQAKGHIFPEEPGLQVQGYFVSLLVNGDHWERHSAVT